jgi:lysophospholipase L1-like esterase
MLPDSVGHVLYNLGVRGDRTQQISQRLEVEFRHRGEIRNRVPDLIILSVGVNDTPRLRSTMGRNYTDFSKFESEIATLLDQAQQLCPLLFVGMVPVDEAKMPFLDCLFSNTATKKQHGKLVNKDKFPI